MLVIIMATLLFYAVTTMMGLKMGYPQVLWIWATLPLFAFFLGLGAVLGEKSTENGEGDN